jgi:hypothetical protein
MNIIRNGILAVYVGEFELYDTVWDDLRVSGNSFDKNVNAPSLLAFGASGGLLAYQFTGTGVTVNQVYFALQIPHSYKLGTNLCPHVHWTPTTTDAGNVVWQLEYAWQDLGAVFSPVTPIEIVDATSGVAWKHQLAEFPEISGAGAQLSSMLICRLFRDPAHASDTYEHDAALLEFDIHFQANTLGSREEYVK